MNDKFEIEARLERSLRNQVHAPKLSRGFDAAVWARIEAAEQPAPRAVPGVAQKSRAAQWLFASNVAGILVAVVLVVYFGLRMFSGLDVRVELPRLSAEQSAALMPLIVWGITGATLAFGLMFTPLGRRLRAELG